MEDVNGENVIEAAKAFGAALFECRERRALKEAEEALRNNKEARRLLMDYQSWKRAEQMARMRGIRLRGDEMASLESLEAKVNSNPLIKNLIESRQVFQDMMENLNAEISNLIGIDFSGSSSTSGCC